MENELVKISIASRSKKGHNMKRLEKPNQDAVLVYPNFQGLPSQSMFGVFDGHGIEGEKVSAQLKKDLPGSIEEESHRAFQTR